MPVLSDHTFLVSLPSGNKAVYSVQPQHMNLHHLAGARVSDIAREHGRQLAHEKDGRWFMPGGWEEITDLRTIALLERAPEADPDELQERATHERQRA